MPKIPKSAQNKSKLPPKLRKPIGRDRAAIRPNPPSTSVGKRSLPKPKLYKPRQGLRIVACIDKPLVPVRLSNAEDCIGYVVRLKPGVRVKGVDYSLQEGVIVDAWMIEDSKGIRFLTYHVELSKVILRFIEARSVNWIDVPKK